MKSYLFLGGGKLLPGTLAAAIWVASCSTPVEQALQPTPQTEAVSFRNGKISFATGDDFANFLNKEFKKPYEAYQQDLRAIVPANAQARINSSGQDDDVVDDPYFAALLDSNHEVLIGGLNFKITDVGTFAFKEEKRTLAVETIRKIKANGGKLPGSSSGRQSNQTDEAVDFLSIEGGGVHWYPSPDLDITEAPDERYVDMEPVAYDANNVAYPPIPMRVGCGMTANTTTHTYWKPEMGGGVNHLKSWLPLKPHHHLKAVVWSEDYGIFSSVGIKSVNQKRGAFWIYYRNAADLISWKIFKGKLVFKDLLGNPVIIPLAGDEMSIPNSSDAYRMFDFNTGKFKVVYGGQNKELDEATIKAAGLSKSYKLKDFHACHFVRDEGATAEIQLKIGTP